MGDYWLPHLAKWHRDAGLDVVEYTGWLTRSRSSGGYDAILAIQDHHDASSPAWTGQRAADALWRDHQFRPVGALATDRNGVHWIGAAGATNTSGLGGPLRCSRGTIPLDSANRFVISREAANNGVGEWWPQLESIRLSDAAIIRGLRVDGAYNARTRQFEQIVLDPLVDIHGHFEWAPTRKIDPAGGIGQSPYARLDDRYLRWDMDRYRSDVAAALAPTEPDLLPEDTDMATIGIVRRRNTADQFALVPIASAEQARRMGIDGQQPVVIDCDLAALEAAVGYQLTPKAGD